MTLPSDNLKTVEKAKKRPERPTPRDVALFLWRAVSRFFGKNRGFLLAGAVGYNALLSLVPLFAILLVALSLVFDEQLILASVATELQLVLPGQGENITAAISAFMADRDVVGSIGFVVLLFFSSIAFRMLGDAFEIIFHHEDTEPRPFIVRALIPYAYIVVIGLSLVALTVITGMLDTLHAKQLMLFGEVYALGGVGLLLQKGLGLIGLILMFSSIYIVMPSSRIRPRRAIVGGIIAACLWEAVRTFLVWYFDTLSLVNVVYGSLAAVVIVLLSMEIAAIILLLGAQIIAELERAERLGVAWWMDLDKIEARLAAAGISTPLSEAEEDDPFLDD